MKIFKLGPSKFTELKRERFEAEKVLQGVIEENLSTFFNNLEFLTSEFQYNNLRPDTVAFDTDKKTFVIIEYKNVKNKQVLDQGATYYRLLKEHKDAFVLLYNKHKNEQYDISKFNWEEIYVIFLSPEFTKYQIGASGIGLPVRLLKIRRYQGGLLTLEPIEDQMNETVLSESRPNDYTEEGYLSGRYGYGKASERTKELYEKIKKKIQDTFDNVDVLPRKPYIGFYLRENNSPICTLDVSRTKIKLAYSISSKYKLITPSDFIRDVTNIGIFGVGDYQSEITNESDLEKALQTIRIVYTYKTSH